MRSSPPAFSPGYGAISPAGTVIASLSSNSTFTLTPSNWFYLASLAIDGVSVGTPGSYTFTNVVTDHTIAANFAAILAANNIPEWWLYQQNTNWAANFDAAALADHDGDGLPAWADYIAGLDPQNPASVFTLNIALANNQQIVTFPTIATTPEYGMQRYYAIESAASLYAAQPWTGVNGWTNIPGVGQPVIYTNTASSQNLFFRARVRLGPYNRRQQQFLFPCFHAPSAEITRPVSPT